MSISFWWVFNFVIKPQIRENIQRKTAEKYKWCNLSSGEEQYLAQHACQSLLECELHEKRCSIQLIKK
jgi:hypothetical protein